MITGDATGNTGINAMNDYLYFENIREHRGSYFVDYQPPVADNPFATLNLIFPSPLNWERVSELLVKEVQRWMGRYRVPLMVWAWDNKEDVIRPPDRNGDCLVAWADPANGKVVQSWKLDDLSNFLKCAPPHPDWRTIFTDVPVRTDAELKASTHAKYSERARQIRLLKIILTLHLALIPSGYAIYEFLGPEWLGLMGVAFVLWKAVRTALKIWGRTKPSAREQEKAEKQRKMGHYFYHCERNPSGFLRLKHENFEYDARERVRKEAADLEGRMNR